MIYVPIRTLIVDDHGPFRWTARELLEHDGSEALDAARGFVPKAALSGARLKALVE